MKTFLLSLCFIGASVFVKAQATGDMAAASAPAKAQIVEASCGTCKFGMESKGCELAVMISGKPYFVDGVDLHKQGDAHASDGICNAVRKAEVTGEVKGDRYVAKTFKLLPQ